VRARLAGRDRAWELRTARLQEVRRYLEGICARWESASGRSRAAEARR
jgi:hypothetical protein